MIAPSILASSDSRCGVNSASSRKPPEQTREHLGPVADDDQRAHVGLQDAVEALAQRASRRHRGAGRACIGFRIAAAAGTIVASTSDRCSVSDRMLGAAATETPCRGAPPALVPGATRPGITAAPLRPAR